MNIWVIMIIVMVLSVLVQSMLQSRFNKYSKIPVANGMSGAEIAEKMLRDNGRNSFKNAILAECLLERGCISINTGYAYIEVPEWAMFCKCVLRAAAACSRDSRGLYFEGGFNVKVAHENGHEYAVHIEIDVNLNGLRYGCIPA